MSIYVDDMYATYGRMKMCHLIAYTTEELLAMVDTIGVARRWIQHAGTPKEHFDIAMSKRALAVQVGAIEITHLALATRCLARDPLRAHLLTKPLVIRPLRPSKP